MARRFLSSILVATLVSVIGIAPKASAYTITRNPDIKEYVIGFSKLGALAEYGFGIIYHGASTYNFTKTDCPAGFTLMNPGFFSIYDKRVGLLVHKSGGQNIVRTTAGDWELQSTDFVPLRETTAGNTPIIWTEGNTQYWGWDIAVKEIKIVGNGTITATYPAQGNLPPVTLTGNDISTWHKVITDTYNWKSKVCSKVQR